MNASGSLRVALCQMNPVVGDIAGNESLIADGLDAARDAGAELVVFPELALSGYPPEDLLFKEHFLRDCERAPQSGRRTSTTGWRCWAAAACTASTASATSPTTGSSTSIATFAPATRAR